MSKLKPCPFCGCDDVYVSFLPPGVSAYCSKCKIGGPICDNQQDAIDEWNTRTPDPADVLREVRDSIINMYDTHRDGYYHHLSTINKIIDRTGY
jgi:Lar family restriction alleviation protein